MMFRPGIDRVVMDTCIPVVGLEGEDVEALLSSGKREGGEDRCGGEVHNGD